MELLSDDSKHETVLKDARLILRADKERWPVPDEIRTAVVKRLAEIVEKREVAVVDSKGGVNYDESIADKNSIAASKALALLVGQNQKDTQPKQSTQPVVQVGVQVNGNPQSGRTLAGEIVKRLRIGGVSSGDSGRPAVISSGGN